MTSSETLIAGRYRIQRVLGEGGMGRLFIAIDERLERPVAVKFLHQELVAADPKFAERFRQEALAACRIRHPAVVEIYDADVHEGSPWLAMELLEGRTLGSLLAERALTVEEAVWVGLEILEGLAAVHEAGFVHRDLKPENLFLQRLTRGRVQMKLLDFGIVKRLAGEEMTHLTATGATIGTPWYVSPEQAAGARDLDQRSDIFSLAVILFECLTRRRPYEADSFGALVTQFYTGAPRRLDEMLEGAPPAFADLLTTCLAVDRNARPASAQAMIEMLSSTGIPPRPLVLPQGGDTVPRSEIESIAAARTGAATPVRPSGTVAMTELAAMPIAKAVAAAASGEQRARKKGGAAWIALAGVGLIVMVGAVGGFIGWSRWRGRGASHTAPVAVRSTPANGATRAPGSTHETPGSQANPGLAHSMGSGSNAVGRALPTVGLADVGLREDPTAGPARVVVGAPNVIAGSGRFAPAVVSWGISERGDALEDCYRDGLRTQGRQAGRIDVRYRLDTTGAVRDASIVESTVSPSIGECVLGVVRPIRFAPGPEGGDVTYAQSMHLGFGAANGGGAR